MKKGFEVGKEYQIEVKNFAFNEEGKKKLDENYIFLGQVVEIYENHIVFHKINTVRAEGFRESFSIWDLNNYQTTEITSGKVA